MRITSKGQVTIPKHIREAVGLMPGSQVEFRIDGQEVRLARSTKKSSRGEAIVRRMRGTATAKLTTDEIMQLTRGE